MLFGAISSRMASGRALAAPAIAEGDGDRLLGFGLAYYITVELGDDLARGKVRETGEGLFGAVGRHGVKGNAR